MRFNDEGRSQINEVMSRHDAGHSAILRRENKLVIGIDASRNRSGGAWAHVLGLLQCDPRPFGIERVHVWTHHQLGDRIAEQPWLTTHIPSELERSIARQLWWQACRLASHAKELRCDLVFATDASTVSRFSPMVVMSQDLLSFEPGMLTQYGWNFKRLRLEAILHVQKWALRRATAAIFLTHYAGRMVMRVTGNLRRVAFIPHGMDEKFRAVNRLPLISGTNRPIRCLYVSNAEPYKNHPQVVAAMAKLRSCGHNVELTLVGGGSGRGLANLNAAVAAADPKREFIRTYDFVPHSELPRFFSQADLFLFASTCENLPVTLLEAMAAQLPIACSDRGPMPEVLADGGVYFDPDDPTDIARVVADLLENEELRTRLAARAQILACSYSWARCGQETWRFLSEVARSAIQ